MTDEAPSRSLEKFIVRLPPGMRERIAAAAEKAGRSMNAEIVQRLEMSFDVDARNEQLEGEIAEFKLAVSHGVAQNIAEQYAKQQKGLLESARKMLGQSLAEDVAQRVASQLADIQMLLGRIEATNLGANKHKKSGVK